jgi:hypothetical protein
VLSRLEKLIDSITQHLVFKLPVSQDKYGLQSSKPSRLQMTFDFYKE